MDHSKIALRQDSTHSTTSLIPRNFEEAKIGDSISVLKKNNGEGFVLREVAKEIRSLTLSYNLIRPMNAVQIVEASKLICQKFFYFKIGDFKLAFHRAKLGDYPHVKILDAMDIRMLIGFLDSYDAERDSFFMGNYIEKKKDYEFNSTAEKLSVMLPILKKVESVMKDKKVHEIKENTAKTGIQSDANILAQQIFRDFDEIYKKQANNNELGIRTILIGEKRYDQEQYFELKMNQKKNENEPF